MLVQMPLNQKLWENFNFESFWEETLDRIESFWEETLDRKISQRASKIPRRHPRLLHMGHVADAVIV
jgi:hypothetical protein